ncbi:hypothetical protein ACFQ7B_39150 [Streptomyces erythrochromogenes]|uniref:hypothetical protein n=1 Tax=Streptomyces erythrochromogenes TaxID=285574 RepID=UPI0036BBB7C8
MAVRLQRVRLTCSPDGLKILREHRKGEPDLTERDGVFYLVAVGIPQPESAGFMGVGLDR